MAGPGSRLEKVGTIFSRVQGLLRSGAVKDSEKPLWYEVYAKFPPKSNPIIDDETSVVPPTNLLYKEDLVRAKFYRTYGNVGFIDMRKESIPSVGQRFVDKYFEARAAKTNDNQDIFETAADALKSENVQLKTLEEIAEEKQKILAKRIEESAMAREDVDKIKAAFGKVTPAEKVLDQLDEDIINPDYESFTREK